MDVRFRVLGLCLLLGLGLPAVPAAAEPQGPQAEAPRPPQRLARPDRRNNIDFLLGALKAAPDADAAKAIEQRILSLWLVSSSDTANLLMTRAKAAIDEKDNELAIRLLSAIVEIKPDYVEAWNRRATLYYQQKDYLRAMADIRQVLAREPRHFGALAGMGLILQDTGDEKHALEIYRRALEVNPFLPRIPDLVKSLSEKIEGRDI
ncbi:MAG TPA: tetratricopeptide repeat protein [Pseudorhodoplanes sp.]|jgi:tetratricopeptide (TPR) repeat protein|nr:tetratricopeptide repeat protein [Pseudorhodoplanes sp.]